jgi:AraC-like DNA-binding protein
METKTLHIKNMVCNRCIKVIQEEFEKNGIQISDIQLGKIELTCQLTDNQLMIVKQIIKENGFELLDEKKNQIVNLIKTTIINRVHYDKDSLDINFSEYLSSKIGYEYSYLSKQFSLFEGTTIEKYIIKQKIEFAKELIEYGKLSLKEVSFKLGYSSVQYFSNQFKKVVGVSPSEYKKSNLSRVGLDQV